MAIEAVREYLKRFNAADRIIEFDVSSATVDLAAQALQCEPERIAKTLSFYGADGTCILIVAAGDAKIDNGKFKAAFHLKAKMLSPEDVSLLVGHAIGGVCPFAVQDTAKVYLDDSLKAVFHTVYPACGSSNSAIEVTIPELEQFAQSDQWVDVCKNWQPEQ